MVATISQQPRHTSRCAGANKRLSRPRQHRATIRLREGTSNIHAGCGRGLPCESNFLARTGI